jgi:hypothetical protein
MATKQSDDVIRLTQVDGLNYLHFAPSVNINRARAGSVRAAKEVLGKIANKLRQGEPLEAAEAEFVADALETAVGDPKRVAKALCLVPRRGAPKRTGAACLAGHDVLALQDEGVPLEDGTPTEKWNGVGAQSRVMAYWHAEYQRKFTDDQLRRGVEAARSQKKRWEAARVAARQYLEAEFHGESQGQ